MKDSGKLVSAATFAVLAVAFAALHTTPVYAQSAVPVRVINTPLPVTVGGPVTVGNAVTVGNPATNPVPTRDVDNPANEPVEFTLCEGTGTSASYCNAGDDTYHVPGTSPTTGKTVKRLVVEYVSGTCAAASDTYVVSLYLVRSFGGGFGIGHSFVPVNVATPGANNYSFAQQTRLYYNPGEGVTAGLARQGVDQLCLWAASGYFVTQ